MHVALIDPSLFTLPYDRALVGGLARAGHRVTLYGRQPGPEDGDPAGLTLIPDFYKVAGSKKNMARIKEWFEDSPELFKTLDTLKAAGALDVGDV